MAYRETVVAVYDTFDTGNKALQALLENGFTRDDIGLAVNNRKGEANFNNVETNVDKYEDVTGAEGSTFGAALGGIAGAAVALSAIVIPGIGPIIAAGPLVALLGGATGALIGGAAGAVTGGITASLVHLGIADDEAEYYAESVRRGNALLTVSVESEAEATKATEVLGRFRPIDVKQRASDWRDKEGWKGFSQDAEPYHADDFDSQRALNTPDVNEPYYGKDDAVRRYPIIPAGPPKNN